MMKSLFTLSALALGVLGYDATLYLRCDNQGSVEVNGVQMATFTAWEQLQTVVIPNFETNPLVKITCTDVGVVGGVIATLKYRQQEYSTGGANSPFVPVSSSDGDTQWVERPRDSSPWNIGGQDVGLLADDAKWVWNNNRYNTVEFELRLWKSATLYLRADDAGEVYLNGNQLASFSNWRALTTVEIPRFRKGMDLKIKVRDVHRVVGGLIASLHFDGNVHSTGPNGRIVPISSNDGDTNWQYYARGSAPWNLASSADAGLIASDAYWVWNNGLENEIEFGMQWGPGGGKGGKGSSLSPVLSVQSSAAASISGQVASDTASLAVSNGARGIAAPRGSPNRYTWTGEDMAVLALAASNVMFVALIACWCVRKDARKKPNYAGVDLESSDDEIKELNEA